MSEDTLNYVAFGQLVFKGIWGGSKNIFESVKSYFILLDVWVHKHEGFYFVVDAVTDKLVFQKQLFTKVLSEVTEANKSVVILVILSDKLV